MSEQDQSNDELSLEQVRALAETYLQASDSELDQDRLDEIENEIASLRSQREEVVENAGEDNFLAKEYNSEIEELEDEREEIHESTENVTQCRNKLLRAVGEQPGFQFSEHWLNSKVLRALTEALYGKQEEELILADHLIAEPADAENLSRTEKLQIKREIMNLAQDRLSEYPRVKNRWEEFKDTRAYPAFEAIIKNPGADPSEIAEMQDDANDSTVRDWTSDLSNKDNLKLVHTPKQGNYYLSTAGKYYSAHYVGEIGGEEKIESKSEKGEETGGDDKGSELESQDSDETQDKPSQQSLGNSVDISGNQSNDPTASDEKVTSAEADSTEEKKEAMFDNVGLSSEGEE